jgi:16S rRNA (adenine1518-N6/adenine1519-N6)-dimethyltransferase
LQIVRPKKSLGQHFLKDVNICRKIAGLVPEQGNDRVLVEIGPGTGNLTKFLPTEGYKAIYLMDIDRDSIPVLAKDYPTAPYHVLLQDFLTLDFTTLPEGDIVIVGNFPYNISSQLFFKMLEQPGRIVHITCMVQREVARRLASGPVSKEYGILSVLLQTWYDIRYEFTVKPGAFIPPPRVDSGVITLSRNSRVDLPLAWPFFQTVVKTAFSQRRKQLGNALGPLLNAKADEAITQQLAPFLTRRAEQLSVDEFLQLAVLLR